MERRSDDTSKHGEGVLETKNGAEQERHITVEGEEWLVRILLLHEGDFWGEESCIAVATDDAFFGSELFKDPLSEALWVELWGLLFDSFCWNNVRHVFFLVLEMV